MSPNASRRFIRTASSIHPPEQEHDDLVALAAQICGTSMRLSRSSRRRASGSKPASEKNCVETIRSSGGIVLNLLNDILDFSKIEAGQLNLERIPFSPTRSIETALDLVRPAANAKRLDLESRIAPDLPATVLGDPRASIRSS